MLLEITQKICYRYNRKIRIKHEASLFAAAVLQFFGEEDLRTA